MAFRWRANDGPTLNSGLVTLRLFRVSGPALLRNPIFVIFQGDLDPLSPPPPPPPPGSVHDFKPVYCGAEVVIQYQAK